MKRALILLLLAASAGASAAAPVTCTVVASRWDIGPVKAAEARLTAARARPGSEELALADALADLAAVTASYTGSPTRNAEGRVSAFDLLGRAQAIWSLAAPEPALAKSLWEHGRRYASLHHCAMALNVLETALAVADKATGGGRLAAPIVRDLVKVAAAMGDDPTLNTLAARLAAGLETDPSPLARDNLDAYLAGAAYYYKTEDNARAEQVTARLLERARAARPLDDDLVRRLIYELASVYYAQLRYKEAQALTAALAQSRSRGPVQHEAHQQTEADMAARVRAGDLKGALALGQETLARYEAAHASSEASQSELMALAQAAAKNASGPDAQAAREKAARARADSRTLQAMIADVQGNVGEVLHALGQHDAALAMYEKALQNYFAPDLGHLYQVARIRAGMALLYRARGDANGALALQQQVHQALLPWLGRQHPDVLEAEAEIAALQLALGHAARSRPTRKVP